MKRGLAAFAVALMLWAAPAKAEDPTVPGGFYAWAGSIVSSTEFLAPQGEFVIFVRPEWENKDTPWTYRLWLGGYIVCKNYPHQLRFDSATLMFRVALEPRQGSATNFPAAGNMPFTACGTFLRNVENRINGRD